MPFDRHDWTVNRCGKEVEYIIDYYSVGGCGNVPWSKSLTLGSVPLTISTPMTAIGSGDDVEYYIDARPKGLAGIPDRLRLAARKIMRGERFW